MQALVIKSKSRENLNLLSEIVKKMGDHSFEISDEDFEDLAFGNMMKKERTGKTVSRSTVMKKLRAR